MSHYVSISKVIHQKYFREGKFFFVFKCRPLTKMWNPFVTRAYLFFIVIDIYVCVYKFIYVYHSHRNPIALFLVSCQNSFCFKSFAGFKEVLLPNLALSNGNQLFIESFWMLPRVQITQRKKKITLQRKKQIL